MISFVHGDLLRAKTDALVNAVNCVGVMGRGLAAQFKRAFPDNFAAYQRACERKEVQPGKMFVVDRGEDAPRYIINFPTKRHWRAASRIEDIEEGLNDLIEQIQSRSISSIAIPPLGCGLGGLDWTKVRPLIEHALSHIPEVQALVYEP
jgi:O-acetyl-ADP-ribose deacetylase (regulator of RNase III)